MMRAMPALAVAVVLAVFAWHPAGLPQAFAQQDKLVHLLGFATLALALRIGLPDLSVPEYAGALLMAASALELVQTFMPSRNGSLADLAADGVGALLGFALADAWRQWRAPATPAFPAAALPRGGAGDDFDPDADRPAPPVTGRDQCRRMGSSRSRGGGDR